MNWVIGIVLIVIFGYLLDREIYFYEGVHLGPRVQAWLYDRWAKKYDTGKRESQLRDDEMLAQPLLDATQNIPEPFILDFATGTGRLSYALISRSDFKGRIIALDLSQGMLEQAAKKLSSLTERRDGDLSSRSRSASDKSGVDLNLTAASTAPTAPLSKVTFLRHLSLPLPFPDSSFDVVCALEVLELFPNMDEPLAEFTRVLRDGGILLTTRGTEASGRRAKVKSGLEISRLLTKNGFETIQITPWWKLFDRVIAIKSGTSNPVEKHKLENVLQCSPCKQIQWERTASEMKCRNCGNVLTVTDEGIVLN